jgi:hypothetical protein
VRYVLLYCPLSLKEREEKLGEIEMAKDLKVVLGTKHEATTTIRLILKTDLLKQFKATV